jgi:hypothetical protein
MCLDLQPTGAQQTVVAELQSNARPSALAQNTTVTPGAALNLTYWLSLNRGAANNYTDTNLWRTTWNGQVPPGLFQKDMDHSLHHVNYLELQVGRRQTECIVCGSIPLNHVHAGYLNMLARMPIAGIFSVTCVRDLYYPKMACLF